MRKAPTDARIRMIGAFARSAKRPRRSRLAFPGQSSTAGARTSEGAALYGDRRDPLADVAKLDARARLRWARRATTAATATAATAAAVATTATSATATG